MTTERVTQCLTHHRDLIWQHDCCPDYAPFNECRPECYKHPGFPADLCLGCWVNEEPEGALDHEFESTVASDWAELGLALRELGDAIVEAFRPIADWLLRVRRSRRWRGRI